MKPLKPRTLSIPLFVTVLFVLWSILIVCVSRVYIAFQIASKKRDDKKKLNFAPRKGVAGQLQHSIEKDRDKTLYSRLDRAYSNCVENLPLFGSLTVIAFVVQYESVFFDQLAWIFLLLRIVQSVFHALNIIWVRASAYAGQLVVYITMAWCLLTI